MRLQTTDGFDLLKLLDEQAETIKSFRGAFEELIHLRIKNELHAKEETKELRAENRKLRKENESLLQQSEILNAENATLFVTEKRRVREAKQLNQMIDSLQRELEELSGSGRPGG